MRSVYTIKEEPAGRGAEVLKGLYITVREDLCGGECDTRYYHANEVTVKRNPRAG